MINKDFMRFGGGGDTFLAPFAIAVLLLVVILLFVLKRKYAIIPILSGIVLIPLSQLIVVGGLHLSCMRLLVALAWVRMLPRVLKTGFKLSKVDKALLLYALSGLVTFTLLWGNVSALVNRAGVLYDAAGMYLLLRVCLENEKIIERAVATLAIVCFLLGLVMLAEHFGKTNIFYVLGVVTEPSLVREGHIRAQGPFGHSILAGCFGATEATLFAGMWWQKRARALMALGFLGGSAMAFSSYSSTCFLAWGAGLAALFMWPLRRWMRVFRWGIVLTLLGLNMVMKAPVWALIGRIDIAGGSSSYHRFELVNQTILHFNEWWLLGEKSTYQWGYDLWDTSNTYVETAVTGGLITLILLITIITICFKSVGTLRKTASDTKSAKLNWTLGATLMSHLVAFFGVSYYDQTIAGWYLLLAMISALLTFRNREQGRKGATPISEVAQPELQIEQSIA